MNNPWELFERHPLFARATLELEKAWTEAKSLKPDQPSKERARAAEMYVYQVMVLWRAVGATDSEPIYELRDRVRHHFGVDGGWL